MFMNMTYKELVGGWGGGGGEIQKLLDPEAG